MQNPESAETSTSCCNERDTKQLTASLVGWYGFENAGDDAFFAVLCQWILNEFKAHRISVSGCDERLPKTAKQLPADIYGNETTRVLGRVERFLQEPKNLFGHDVVIFGGGSIFSRRRFWWLAVQMSVLKGLRRLRLCRTVVAGVGVSIGPFQKFGDNFWCKRALRLFDLVMVRDVQSWDIGRQYGLSNLIASMDLALALPSFYDVAKRVPRAGSTDQPVIGFSVVDRDTEFGSPEIDDVKRTALVDALLSIAGKYPLAQFKGLIFCKHHHAGDYVATNKVLEPLRAAGCNVELVEYDNDPVSLCGTIAGLDAMICNRMHSFVFSCLTHTPAVMISYASKMDEFAKSVEVPNELIFEHDSLDSNRLEQTLIKLLEKQALPCDLQGLAKCTEQVLADLDSAAAAISAAHPDLA